MSYDPNEFENDMDKTPMPTLDEPMPKPKTYQATIRIPAGYAFKEGTCTGVRKHDKVMPNDLCPCGSNVKAKKCCFKNSKVTPSKN